MNKRCVNTFFTIDKMYLRIGWNDFADRSLENPDLNEARVAVQVNCMI